MTKPICRAFFHFQDAPIARLLIAQERRAGRRVEVRWNGTVMEVSVYLSVRRQAQQKAARMREEAGR